MLGRLKIGKAAVKKRSLVIINIRSLVIINISQRLPAYNTMVGECVKPEDFPWSLF